LERSGSPKRQIVRLKERIMAEVTEVGVPEYEIKLSREEAGALFNLLFQGVAQSVLTQVGLMNLLNALCKYFENDERTVWYDEVATIRD
jgi:hypothetical protein